jgi:hypothetical protein
MTAHPNNSSTVHVCINYRIHKIRILYLMMILHSLHSFIIHLHFLTEEESNWSRREA